MLEIMFWGFVLRATQSLLQASPFILAGLFVAAVFRRLMGRESTRRLFAAGTRRSLFQAWLVGMLLPVCSLGVIPIAREMKKAGIAGGTILAFAMAAPLFNPLSLLYGLTLSEPLVILAFAFCTLVVVTVVGMIWDCTFPRSEDVSEHVPQVPYGVKRLLAVLVAAAREMTGPSLGYMLIGLVGVGMLGAVLPHGSLQRAMNRDNPAAPLVMAAVAVPVYATPMLAMSQLGMMFQHANSVGAAFVLLVLGAGMNVGLLFWMVRNYGLRRSAAWFGLLMVVVLALAYGVDKPLEPSAVEAADHTHAFDIYCRPFASGTAGGMAQIVLEKLQRDTQLHERYAVIGLCALLVLGLALRVADGGWVVEHWLERTETSARPAGRFDVAVPGVVLGAVGLVGLILFSVIGCYAYYPPPHEVFEEMRIVKTEALTASLAEDSTQAKYWIEVLDDWTRKLQVGVYLREGQLSDYHRMKARLLREKLELLEHEVADRETDEIRHLVSDIQLAYGRLRRAYLEER